MSDPRTILVDTREQRPWRFPDRPTRDYTLHYGDYSAHGLVGRFEVERKSLADFVGSMTRGWSAFRAKIKRWMRACPVRVIVVEGLLEEALAFRYLKPHQRPWLLRNICILQSTGTSILFVGHGLELQCTKCGHRSSALRNGTEARAAELAWRMIDDRRLQKAEGEFEESIEAHEQEEQESEPAMAGEERDPTKPWY